jgi:hypothetical protein
MDLSMFDRTDHRGGNQRLILLDIFQHNTLLVVGQNQPCGLQNQAYVLHLRRVIRAGIPLAIRSRKQYAIVFCFCQVRKILSPTWEIQEDPTEAEWDTKFSKFKADCMIPFSWLLNVNLGCAIDHCTCLSHYKWRNDEVV